MSLNSLAQGSLPAHVGLHACSDGAHLMFMTNLCRHPTVHARLAGTFEGPKGIAEIEAPVRMHGEGENLGDMEGRSARACGDA